MPDQVKLEFVSIDDWNRPVFKMPGTKMYFGSTDVLFSWNSDKESVLKQIKIEDLCYFGSTFNCEPQGGLYLHKDKILNMKSGKTVELVL